MSFSSSLASNNSFKPNFIILLRGIYYGKHAPDSDTGGAIAAAGGISTLISSFTESPSVIEIDTAKTSFFNINIGISDYNGTFTADFVDNETLFMGEELRAWVGRVGESMDFGDYLELPKTYVKSVTYKDEQYSIKAEEYSGKLQAASFNLADNLASDASAGAGTLVASVDLSEFPASGKLYIEDGDESEIVTYSSISTLTITLSGVTTYAHSAGVVIYDLEDLTGGSAENPIDLFLKLCISNGGGGAYDTLRRGLGISNTLFDITGIEAIRDEFFVTDTVEFKLYGIGPGSAGNPVFSDTLDFMEEQLFIPNNVRLITNSSGKIGLAVIDQAGFADATNFDQSNIVGKSEQYKIDTTKVRNKVIFKYNYDYETKTFVNSYIATDAPSIVAYGEREPFIIEAQGVTDSGIAIDRSSRWLERLSRARASIMLSTLFCKYETFPGDSVQVTARLPTAAGTLNYSSALEVISKSVNHNEQEIEWELQSTAETGLRRAFISPTDPLLSITGVRTVTVPTGRAAFYEVSYKVVFVDKITGDRDGSDPSRIKTITSISGDNITVTPNILGDVFSAPTDFNIQFADYDEVSDIQKARYGFVSNTAGADYADGTPPYQINY